MAIIVTQKTSTINLSELQDQVNGLLNEIYTLSPLQIESIQEAAQQQATADRLEQTTALDKSIKASGAVIELLKNPAGLYSDELLIVTCTIDIKDAESIIRNYLKKENQYSLRSTKEGDTRLYKLKRRN